MEIVPVQTRAQWRDFHHLPYRVYRDDPSWVAPLLIERQFHFMPKHNPFFAHAKAAMFLAYAGETPVGRITAQIDQLHLARYHDATGHFGFIEAMDDKDIFARLLATAEDWLREEGMKRALGPVSFAMWDQPGLLIEGFDTPPYVLMGHAPRYYASRIEEQGYAKAEDLLAYEYTREMPVPQRMQQILERLSRQNGIVLRNLRKEKTSVDREVGIILDIVNDGWSENWGFVPMTEAEIDDIAGILKLLLDPGDGVFAEYQGEPVAFALTFPNVNEAAHDLNGHLFPFGFVKLLWRLKVRGTRSARLALMGIRKSVQDSPLGGAIALAMIKKLRDYHEARGSVRGELSWVLDRNTRVKRIIEMAGARPYKRYRIYGKSLV